MMRLAYIIFLLPLLSLAISTEFNVNKNGKHITITLPNNQELLLNKIPAGRFLMGSPASEKMGKAWERPVHDVEITNDFFMGRYEITNAQFRAFNPKHHSRTAGGDLDGDQQPVVNVTWFDALAFCQWLSQKTQLQVRLATEAEWEYACRAGTTTRFYTTDVVNGVQQAPQLFKACWYGPNSKKVSHDVGTREANAFGLHDLHGNVFEWCMDWFAEDYYKQSPSKNPLGPDQGTHRILRGGSYVYYLHHTCRSAYRYSAKPHYHDANIGFRIVIDGDSKEIHPQAQLKPATKEKRSINRPKLHKDEVSIKQRFGGPVMTIAQPQSAIKIDGQLNETAWSHITPQPMELLNGRAALPTQFTSVKVCADAKNIYVAFRCEETEMHRLTSAGDKRDGRIWAGDSVEIFLDPQHTEKRNDYYHISINPDGLTMDIAKGDKTWNPKIQAIGHKGDNHWTMEVALPLADLNITDKIPRLWGINFTRFRPELNAGRPQHGTLVPHEWPVDRPDLMRASEDSAWSPTLSDSNHLPESFGHAIFEIGTEDIPEPRPLFELISKEDFSNGTRGLFSAGEVKEGGFQDTGKSLYLKKGEVARYHLELTDLQNMAVITFAKTSPGNVVYWHSFGEIYGSNKLCWNQVDNLTRDTIRLPPLFTYNDGAGRLVSTSHGIADPYHAGYQKHLSWFSEASGMRICYAGPKHYAVAHAKFGPMRTQHPHNKPLQPNKDKLRGIFLHTSRDCTELEIGGIVIFRGRDIEPPKPVTSYTLNEKGDNLELRWEPAEDNTWTIWYRLIEIDKNGNSHVIRECPDVHTLLNRQAFAGKTLYLQGVDFFENMSAWSKPIKIPALKD